MRGLSVNQVRGLYVFGMVFYGLLALGEFLMPRPPEGVDIFGGYATEVFISFWLVGVIVSFAGAIWPTKAIEAINR